MNKGMNEGIDFVDLNNESNRKEIISQLKQVDELKDLNEKEIQFYLTIIIEKINIIKEKIHEIITCGTTGINVDEIQSVGNEILKEIALSEDEEVNVDFIFHFLYHFLVNSNINIDENPHYTGE